MTDLTAALSDSASFWQAILRRDESYDGLVYYGVTSTGIFCRPSCPSRRPKRENVILFASREAARRAGFRACKRCRPDMNHDAGDEAWRMVRTLCRLIEDKGGTGPSLADLSAGSVQGLFRRVLGVSPKRYGQALRLGRLKRALAAGDAVTQALYAAGYGSSSRLYETAGRALGMTPARYQKRGAGVRIKYAHARAPGPFGVVMVAASEAGLCSVKLGDRAEELEADLRAEFEAAELQEDRTALAPWLRALTAYLEGAASLPDMPLDIAATAFQARVWQALRALPSGMTATYSEIAAQLGQPTASRAVARACATNPVALVIPCHRIVPKGGGIGGYRWGAARKEALLKMEAQCPKLHHSNHQRARKKP